MSSLADHDESGPPPSPVPSAPEREATPPPTRSRTGSFPSVGEGDGAHALRIVRDLRDGPAGVGKPPIAATGFEGTGLWKFTAEGFAAQAKANATIEASLVKILAWMQGHDTATAKRGEAAGGAGLWLAKEVGRLLVAAFVVAVLAYLSGHWR